MARASPPAAPWCRASAREAVIAADATAGGRHQRRFRARCELAPSILTLVLDGMYGGGQRAGRHRLSARASPIRGWRWAARPARRRSTTSAEAEREHGLRKGTQRAVEGARSRAVHRLRAGRARRATSAPSWSSMAAPSGGGGRGGGADLPRRAARGAEARSGAARAGPSRSPAPTAAQS